MPKAFSHSLQPLALRAQPLTDLERQVYEWQMWVAGFGEEGQRRLKGASVLISRCGGVGGAVALELAAAGVGRLILAHAGNLKPSDLNRQILMTHDWLGRPRVECAAQRLRALNPRLEVVAVGENVSEANVAGLVGQADVVADCAPLFEERLLMNREAVRQGKPMVECAVYELEAQITTIVPGQTPCLACLCPEPPATLAATVPGVRSGRRHGGMPGRNGGDQALDGAGRTLAEQDDDVRPPYDGIPQHQNRAPR